MTRNTSDARPATVIATTFASPAATVSRTFAVSPLQMRFRTPRRAHARRSCLQARTCAGEMATFAMHKRMYSQERGRKPPWLGNTNGVLEKTSTIQRHATDSQERGRKPPVVRRSAFAMPPPSYSEH